MTSPAEAIAAGLSDAGVDVLFGVPGGGNNLDVIGACEAAGIRFVLAHTETGAAIMASAWGEVRGSTGACVVTRGPGAASVVNGAAQADQDRQPLLVLTDTVDAANRPRIAHQNIDQTALFAPVTRWSTTLGRAEPGAVVADALAVADTAPRGAVHLDIDPTTDVRPTPPVPTAREDRAGLAALTDRITRSRRPLLVVGVAGRRHATAVRDWIAGTGIPVMTTYKARGVVPDSGPNSAGAFTGSVTDGLLVEQADLVVTIGLDSIELIPNPWPYAVPVVSLAESVDPYGYISPDVTVMAPLADLLAALPRPHDDWPAGAGAGHRARIAAGLAAGPAAVVGTDPAEVVLAVRAAAQPGSIATVDAGAHMLVAMPLWDVEAPGEVLISSGLATMGYSLPAAVGAALARPGVRVYCFVGDGGLSMCLGELETLARLRLDVTVVAFDDRTLSLIKAKQRPSGHGGAGAVEYGPVDYAAVATAMGVPGTRIGSAADLRTALAAPTTGPMLLDVEVPADGYPHVIDVVRSGKLG